VTAGPLPRPRSRRGPDAAGRYQARTEDLL